MTLLKKIIPKMEIDLPIAMTRAARCTRTQIIPTMIDAAMMNTQNFSSALTMRMGINPSTHSSCFNSIKKRGGIRNRTPKKKNKIRSKNPPMGAVGLEAMFILLSLNFECMVLNSMQSVNIYPAFGSQKF